jgi:hypothetical protein
MINKITTDTKYRQVTGLIEKFIEKATVNGGFNSLPVVEQEELAQLSSLAEQYEDDILKTMPLSGNA